ncbi:MAG: YheT family hydrolase [Gemmatimonadota bacterium]
MRSAFRPAPGLGNPHVQTVLGKLLRPSPVLASRRERLETPDGDFVDVDLMGAWPRAGEPAGPIVVVLHGLEGRSTRRYMRLTYVSLLERGLRPVGLNFRGCSGEPNRTARAYHSGETGDLRLVLETLRDRFGGPLGVVGYSLGGNVALRFLGQDGAGEPATGPTPASELVAAGAAVSVPFDLDAGGRALEGSVIGRGVYTRYFMRSLRRKVLEKGDLVAGVCDAGAVLRARTIREFDEAFTAPIFGFDDAADYYARASSARFIPGIDVPTLIVHSRDDPFLPADRIPEAAMRANPAVTPVITERGGHQGYVAGSLLRPRFWVEEVVGEWMRARLLG